MATVFDEILTKGIRSGQAPARTKEARDWYRNTALKNSGVRRIRAKSPAALQALGGYIAGHDKSRTTTKVDIGSMYMFAYDPKLKKTLPFYDRFPLIFPIGPAKGGFYGINMHYLPHTLRAKLMDALYKTVTDENYNEQTKLNISYQILKTVARVKYYKPTVKHYLNKHVKSNFIFVFPSEWDICLFLPTEQFSKASKEYVWEDSRKKIY